MEMYLAPLSMMYKFRNLFVLPEYILVLMTSTTEINTWLIERYCYTVIDTIHVVKLFSKFYFSNSKLIVKYNMCLRTLLQQCIVFNGNIVYEFNWIDGKPSFSDQLKDKR